MKNKKVKNLVIFMIGLALLLVGSSFLVKPKGYDCYNLLSVTSKVNAIDQEEENSLDVLFLGDSESCDVYSPVQLFKEYGITSYNTGARALRICDSYAILQETLKKQTPKLVVIEADSLFYTDTIYDSSDTAQAVTEQILPITHYHTFYKELSLPELIPGKSTETAKADKLKGFWVRTASVPYTGRTDYMDASSAKASMTDDTEDYLEKTVNLAKEHGAQVLIVASPTPKNWTLGKHLCVSQWASQNDVEFLDLNDSVNIIGLDWSTDSLDKGDHVNLSGSKKINTYFGRWIQRVYNLQDHRDDTDYQSWTDLVNETDIYD